MLERLVPAHPNSYRDEAKIRGSHFLAARFGHQTCPEYMGFRSIQTVLLVILGLLKFVQNSPIKPIWGGEGAGPYIAPVVFRHPALPGAHPPLKELQEGPALWG